MHVRTRSAIVATLISLLVVSVFMVVSNSRESATAAAALLQTAQIDNSAIRQDSSGRYEARIRRTSYGIPHIEAANLASLGFGEGYAQGEDHLCTIAEQVLEARGERAKYFGRGQRDRHLQSDIVVKALRVRERAGELHSAEPQEIREWVEGFAEGYNTYLQETGKNAVPGWCRGHDWVFPIAAVDVAAIERLSITDIPGLNVVGAIANAEPPRAGAAMPPQSPAGDASERIVVSASNGWALGRRLTENGRGMLLANPHQGWIGPSRPWEKHLTIPGDLDVYGAGPVGHPGLAFGFNNAVGWTATNSRGERATFYTLELVPSTPTRYRYGSAERAMIPVAPSVEVRGEAKPVERTIWFTHYGPVLTPPGVPWTTTRALAMRNANELNGGRFTQWLAMSRAKSMADLQMAYANHQRIPAANTIATSADGAAWYIDSSATPNLSAAAIGTWLARRINDALTRELWQSVGMVLLDGSDPTFEWQDDPAARRPGIVPFRNFPQLERDDYVFNANDGFWFAHARARIDGDYSPLHGAQRVPLSTRTRSNVLQLSNAPPYAAAGQDGKFSLAELQVAVLANRSLAADLLVPELVDRCKATPRVTVEGRDVDLTKACVVLGAWDRRFDLESRGAVLFREWLGHYTNQDLRDRGRLFAVAFDPADPIGTPRGLAADGLALENLAKAIRILDGRNIPLDAPLAEFQYAFSKLPRRIAIHGGTEQEGVLNKAMRGVAGEIDTLQPRPLPPPVAGSRFLTEAGYPVTVGSCFLMALEFTNDGPRAMAILTYSQSSDPVSEHFADQTELFSKKQWRPVLFKREAVVADTKRDYKVTASRR
jgi:acyl-homoserine-lactone acylase